jgi:REP element-mobilizing transposase RayT
MPDRRRGYVRRGAGVLAPDLTAARRYAEDSAAPAVLLGPRHQRLMLQAATEACAVQRYRLHAAAFDPTHVHMLVSWRIERGWLRVRMRLRQAITRQMNAHFGRRAWFSRGASRHRVRERRHFDYLVSKYLPGHRGLCWSEGANP